jgi:hypothetical protein
MKPVLNDEKEENADMKARVFNRAVTTMVVVTLAGTWGMASQVQAQNTSGNGAASVPDPSNTGAGPRGTPIAPSTNLAQPTDPAAKAAPGAMAQQAAPSEKPAAQATPEAVEQQNRSQTGQPSGEQQAAPSGKPAPEATTEGVKSEMKKSTPK